MFFDKPIDFKKVQKQTYGEVSKKRASKCAQID